MLPHQSERRRVLCGRGLLRIQLQQSDSVARKSRDEIDSRYVLSPVREHQLNDLRETFAGAAGGLGDGFQWRGLLSHDYSLLRAAELQQLTYYAQSSIPERINAHEINALAAEGPGHHPP